MREARWGHARLITLDLRSPHAAVRLDFTEYPLEQMRELIRYFRFHVPEGLQRNWGEFWAAHWRLFDYVPLSDEERAAEQRAWRKRMDLLFLVCLPIPLTLVAFLAWAGDVRPVLPMAVIPVFWLLARSLPQRIHKDGRLLRRQSEPMVGRAAAIWLGGAYLSILVWPLMRPWGETAALVATTAVFAAFLVPMLVSLQGTDRRLRDWREKMAPLAEQDYMRRPADAKETTC